MSGKPEQLLDAGIFRDREGRSYRAQVRFRPDRLARLVTKAAYRKGRTSVGDGAFIITVAEEASR